MKEHGLAMRLTDEAKDLLVEQGYDPTMGARPLRRAIQRLIEDPLSDRLLSGGFPDGSTVTLDRDGEEMKLHIQEARARDGRRHGGWDDRGVPRRLERVVVIQQGSRVAQSRARVVYFVWGLRSAGPTVARAMSDLRGVGDGRRGGRRPPRPRRAPLGPAPAVTRLAELVDEAPDAARHRHRRARSRPGRRARARLARAARR